MVTKAWSRLLLVAAALQLGIAGCSTPQRLPAVPTASIPQADTGLGQVRYLVARETDTFAADAHALLQREHDWLASQGRSGQPLPPAYFLAISGGGDNGAFGAGLLNGWSAAGTRPEFKVVTGVSTGALIAPFAFLGPKYDFVLERVYTQTSQKDIFKKRGMIKGIFGDAMADTRPLADVIASYVNQQLLDEIAAEYAKGRVLLVGTGNLDSLEPVIWNMTAIAASKDPRAIPLFRQILLASASIPGAFPPVMIDVEVGGTRYQEMHVDGGTMAQVFLFPPSITAARVGAGERKRVVYIIRNARLDVDWASVERRTLSIASRAIGSLTRTQGIGDLYRIYVTTQKDGIDFNLAYIPPTFNVPHVEEFDTNYMQQLYTTGQQMAQAGYQWQKYPPGFEAPATADAK
jgi:predicted acylesterase/phospholipase RssA